MEPSLDNIGRIQKQLATNYEARIASLEESFQDLYDQSQMVNKSFIRRHKAYVEQNDKLQELIKSYVLHSLNLQSLSEFMNK
jgi:DNA-binding PucR family transcriptional regulator